MGKQSRNTSSEFSGFAAFASHTSSASTAMTRIHEQQQQQQQQEANNATNSTRKANKLKPSPIYTGTDSQLIQIFKRIGQKRDATTKARALDEFIKYAYPVTDKDSKSSQSVTANATDTATAKNNREERILPTPLKKSDQIVALSHFFFLFANKLIHDNNSSVRSESLKVLGCAMIHVPKAFKTLLLHQNQDLTETTSKSNYVGSIGNIIGWVYTSIHSQIMEVSRVAEEVWIQMKDLLDDSVDRKNNDNDNNDASKFIKERMVAHVEAILQNSSRASNLADALSVIGGKKDSSSMYQTKQSGKGKGKGKFNKDATVAGSSNANKGMSESDRDEMEERYERVVLITLNGMNHFFASMPENKDQGSSNTNTSSFTYESQFTNIAVLWKHLSNGRGSFRKASFNLITSICQHATSIIHPKSTESGEKKHNLSALIIKSLSSEKDPSNFPSLFEMILLYIVSFRKSGKQEDTWSDVKAKSGNSGSCYGLDSQELTKTLSKTLRRACYGSPSSQWGPSMLPLTVSLPLMEQQLQVLAALWSGRTSAISAADAADIVSAVSECSTYLLLRVNDSVVSETDAQLSIEIAQAFLESLSYYLMVPSGGSASVMAEKNLLMTLVKDLHKLDTLGSTERLCYFSHIRDWFWNEGIMNIMVTNEQISANTLLRMKQLLDNVAETFEEEKLSEESNLCQVFQIVFWAKLQPSESEIPIFEEASLMVCIMNFCGIKNIFSDESGALSSNAIEHFCANTLIHWIVYHTSLSISEGSEKELKPFFVMLRLMLVSLTKRTAIWELILNGIIHAGFDLTKLSLGLRTLVSGLDREICSEFNCETLDSLSVDTAKNVLQSRLHDHTHEGDSESEAEEVDNTGSYLFLRICAGLEAGIPCRLVGSNTIHSWVQMCVSTSSLSTSTIFLYGRKNGLLEILLSICKQKSTCPINEEDVLQLIMTVWNEGPPTWDMKELDVLMEMNTARLSKIIKTSSSILKNEMKDNHFKQENLELAAFMWSQRAWRLIEMINRAEETSEKRVSLLGIDNVSLWRSAIRSNDSMKADFICLSLVQLLQKFSTASDRRRFLLENDNGEISILVLLFMTLAKGGTNCISHSQLSRCGYMSSLLGGIEKSSDADTKLFISDSICILSALMKDQSHEEEMHIAVGILDWFIGLILDKYVPSPVLDLSTDEVNPNEVKEGDTFWYIIDGSKQGSERVKVTIVKIHADDFPNLYFTIQVGDSTRQTISSRLRKHPLHIKKTIKATKPTNSLIPWIEESITTKIVKPHFFDSDSLINEAAAECLNIVISRCGLQGSTGIGSMRYDIFQLMTKLEKEIHNQLNEGDIPGLSANLNRISRALGYGICTSISKENSEILRFPCNDLMTNLLNFFENEEVWSSMREGKVTSLNTAMIMWFSVSVKRAMNETNAAQIWSLINEIISAVAESGCYNDYERWLSMIIRLLESMQEATASLPSEMKAAIIDSEQSTMSCLIRIFNHCDSQSSESSAIGEYFGSTSVGKPPSYFSSFNSFIVSHLHAQSASVLYAAHMQVEGLCDNLQSQDKQWCAFQILSALTNKNNQLYKKDDSLSHNTNTKLDEWLKKLEEEEAAEIEEDVLVAGMWIPRYLMNALENLGQKEFKDNDDIDPTSNLLEWLLCLDFLDAAASSDMRNRAHIGSYINLTGAAEYMINLALHHANLDNHKSMDWFTSTSLDNEQRGFILSDLATLVLFRSAESIPTLFKSWWSEDCHRSIQPVINKFVEAMVAPETLRRELDRIHEAANLDEMTVSGSCVSREVVATYVQDECNLSVRIRVPPSFPLRNVEVDCQKTLGISEKRWRHWALQIMLMLNSQDGSILDALMLWKQNVDKEFEGVEPCPICYSVLCVKTHAMPNLECKTCKNRFHSSCLYKWFNSSGKSQCPLCQQPWSGTKVGGK